MRSRRRLHTTIALSLPLLGGCDTAAPIACSTVFQAVTVAVVDSTAAPVPDATVIATLMRTGERLSPTSLALLTSGTYILVDDGSREKLRTAGDSVGVTARRGTGPTTAAMYFIDVPGGCDVRKVSGPDTLMVH